MKKQIWTFLSYVLVAALSTVLTMGLLWREGVLEYSKLDQLEDLIEERFIGEADLTALEDAAADAMVRATGDRWSYYISAEEYAEYEERMATIPAVMPMNWWRCWTICCLRENCSGL